MSTSVGNIRRGHVEPFIAAGPGLWLGKQGRPAASGSYQIIKDRGIAVGLPDPHPHRLRRTFSHEWLASGGSEGNLMHRADWKARAKAPVWLVEIGWGSLIAAELCPLYVISARFKRFAMNLDEITGKEINEHLFITSPAP
jgi:hypothetical protein